MGALEQPIYNPGDETIMVLISLEDTAKGAIAGTLYTFLPK